MPKAIDFKDFSTEFTKTFGNRLKLISGYGEYKNLDSLAVAECSDAGHPLTIKKARLFRRGFGCKFCNESRGERYIRLILEDLKIKFQQEKRFASCRNKKELPFDFYLTELGCLIEFHGSQHFESKEMWGGNKAFQKLKKRDLIKKKWCKKNSIPLLEITSYKDIRLKILQFLDANSKSSFKDLIQRIKNVEKKWENEQFFKYKQRLQKIHPTYNFAKTKWKWGQRKVKYFCENSKHGEIKADLFNLLKGHGCSKCAGNETDLQNIIDQSFLKFGNSFDFSNSVFKNTTTKMSFICKEHGKVTLTPEHHLRLSKGCLECSPQALKNSDKEFQKKVKKFDGKFSYFYKKFSSQKKIQIYCKEHDYWFKALPSDHSRNQTGCCTHCVALKKSVDQGNAITVDGKIFNSISKAANFYGLKSATVRKRLRKGKSIKDAFELK